MASSFGYLIRVVLSTGGSSQPKSYCVAVRVLRLCACQKNFQGSSRWSPIACAKILVKFGPHGVEIWRLEGFSYCRILTKPLPQFPFGVTLSRPGRPVGHQSFSGRGCHTAEGAASVILKWLSLRLVLEAYMLEFGG